MSVPLSSALVNFYMYNVCAVATGAHKLSSPPQGDPLTPQCDYRGALSNASSPASLVESPPSPTMPPGLSPALSVPSLSEPTLASPEA